MTSPEFPESFDLLGFTHYWRKTRKGNWAVRRKTMASRLTRSTQAIYQWCRIYRHLPVKEQWEKLSAKMHGHYGYYGIPGNSAALGAFRCAVERIWRKWLRRRNRERKFNWRKFLLLSQRYPLPPARLVWNNVISGQRSAQLTLF
jgi:hypothetical protein